MVARPVEHDWHADDDGQGSRTFRRMNLTAHHLLDRALRRVPRAIYLDVQMVARQGGDMVGICG
jgi:hypothetical protein